MSTWKHDLDGGDGHCFLIVAPSALEDHELYPEAAVHRLGELVTAAVAGSFFAQHGKKVATQKMLSPLLRLLWRWHILENGSWKVQEHSETQGCNRTERHSGITCAVPRRSRLFSPVVTSCTSRRH